MTATASIIMAVLFDLSAIASIGSAVALVVFTLVTVGHFRVRQETGAKAWPLVLANLTTVVVLVSFAVTTLAEEPGTTVALVVILLLSVVLDLVWKRSRGAAQGRGHEPASHRPVRGSGRSAGRPLEGPAHGVEAIVRGG